MKRAVIGTAGHIDHGKTTLVKALTGIDPDRLPEEKARGMTIDLGFAYMDLEGGWRLGIVDVPGHERFVKNMLAGATGIDIALLVVAADDGVMPQTLEHLEILKLLGLKHGVIVISKTDLVEREWLELVKEDVRDLVKGTSLEGTPIVEVSSLKKEGIDELKRTISGILEGMEEETVEGFFRLPIDRAFTIQGFGCVVTGTVLSGQVKMGEEVELLPVKEIVRVKGIEIHGEKVECAVRGQRAALNLGGIKTSEVRRGFELSVPGYLNPTELVDSYLHHLSSARRPIQNGERVRLHIATSEVMGRVVLLDKESLKPGEEAFVQFRLEGPVVAERGERYVIRSYSPCRTIGGGKVLRSSAYKLKRLEEGTIKELRLLLEGNERKIIEQTLTNSKHYLLSEEDLVRFLNIYPARVKEAVEELTAKGILEKVREDSRVLLASRQRLDSIKLDVLKKLEDFHKANPLRLGMEELSLRTQLVGVVTPSLLSLILTELNQEGHIKILEHKISRSNFKITLAEGDKKILETLERAFLEAKFSPPGFEALLPQEPSYQDTYKNLLSLLLEQKTLIEVEQGLYFHKKVVEELKKFISDVIKDRGYITVADLRDLIHTSRKYAVPLLEYLDKIHFTKREGDKRILCDQNS